MESQIIKLNKQIRWRIGLFMAGLILSGLTAIPLQSELGFLLSCRRILPAGILSWLAAVYSALTETGTKYPFIAYGTDWLAFAHLVIALVFIGPWQQPVRNIWVIKFGIMACLAVLPVAFIAGTYRGIPFFWQLIDCSFGILGLVFLLPAYGKALSLQSISETSTIPSIV